MFFKVDLYSYDTAIKMIKFIVFVLVLPDRIRIDKGTETGVMATIHCYLRDKVGDVDDATETVLYGPSTQNKIERWWRELLERLERYFKAQLNALLETGEYDPSDENDRYCILLLSS